MDRLTLIYLLSNIYMFVFGYVIRAIICHGSHASQNIINEHP